MSDNTQSPLLEVNGLKTYFFTEDGTVQAVDGVSFDIYPGEVLGIVGESGCGKSVTALSILRLVGRPGRIVEGTVEFGGINLLELPLSEMQDVRGNMISMIFQQPQTSLNPVINVGDQVGEVFEIHSEMINKDIWDRSVDLLRIVGIPDPTKKAHAYPHEMSGGQAQRVMIAMALALNPKLLIADEPTTALDVTIQAQVLFLMRELVRQMGTAVILITHDLGVVAENADRVAVMYAGKIVELAEVHDLYNRPFHPYTQGLIASIPVLGESKDRLEVIDGNVPNLINLPPGCRFASRCKIREELDLSICLEMEPQLVEALQAHPVRCWLYQDQLEKGHKAPKTIEEPTDNLTNKGVQ